MHLKTFIDRKNISTTDPIKMRVEIDFSERDSKISEDKLNDYVIYFDSIGAISDIDELSIAKAFKEALGGKGRFETEVEFRPENTRQVTLFVGINHGGNRVVRRSHTLELA